MQFFKKMKYEKLYTRKSYALEGEDILLESYCTENGINKGFYVDIGALHPIRYSNTHLFYKKGWHGINIDATPGSMKEFNKMRPRDINVEAVISNEEKEITYYLFHEPAFNTFDEERTKYLESINCRIKDKIKLKTQKINDILDKNVPKGQNIDFINIDIEGVDYEVVSSIDYDKYAPKFFIIEELDYVDKDFMEYSNSKMYKFLSQKGYKVIAKTMRTVIYGRI